MWVADNGRGVPATVRDVIEAHGGNVGLGPSSLGGTTVWFELPR